MNNLIIRYISDFANVYDGDPWYGRSVMSVLRDVDPETVFRRPGNGVHSIYEITKHMLAWRQLLVKRLNGDTGSKISMNSAEDWSEIPGGDPATAWKKILREMEANQAALAEALSKWKDEALDQPFCNTPYSLRIFLDGHLQHDIYHTGQVAWIMKV
ncbi:MAG: DinB family protein [Chitinophagaceae bacterium]